MTKKEQNSNNNSSNNNNIGSSGTKNNSNVADLFTTIVNSDLTETQKEFLALKVLQNVLNDELKTTENVIFNLKGLKRTVDESITKYQTQIQEIQNVFAEHFTNIFEQLETEQKITPAQKESGIDYYAKRLPFEGLKSERSALQKALKSALRGFDGSTKGAEVLKPYYDPEKKEKEKEKKKEKDKEKDKEKKKEKTC